MKVHWGIILNAYFDSWIYWLRNNDSKAEAIALAARFIQLRLPFLIFLHSAPKPHYNYSVILSTSYRNCIRLNDWHHDDGMTGIEDLAGDVDLDFPEPLINIKVN